MKKINIYLIIALHLLLSACTSDSEDDLLIPVEPVAVVTYDDNVKTIIDSNCLACHTNPAINGASVPLTTFQDVRSAVQNLNIINRISAQPGDSGFMPLGGARLPQSSIDLIVQWEADGFLENNN